MEIPGQGKEYKSNKSDKGQVHSVNVIKIENSLQPKAARSLRTRKYYSNYSGRGSKHRILVIRNTPMVAD
jgi:hypothetical protein